MGWILSCSMDFKINVQGEPYEITVLKNNSYLISGKAGEYILFKRENWLCAEDMDEDLVEDVGEQIEKHLQLH
jgi:hypothetical protein